jgi:hypothetical protein
MSGISNVDNFHMEEDVYEENVKSEEEEEMHS